MQPSRLLCPWDFPGKNAGVGCQFLLQGAFLTQGSNPNLLYCRQITPAPPGKTNIQAPNKYYCHEPCQVLGTESRDIVPLLDKVKGISAAPMSAQCQDFAKSSMIIVSFLVHSAPGPILQMRKLRTQKIEGTICGLSNFKAEIPSSSWMTRAQKEKEHTLREIYKEKHYSTFFPSKDCMWLSHDIIHMWNLTIKNDTTELIYKQTHRYKKHKREAWQRGINQELGINR